MLLVCSDIINMRFILVYQLTKHIVVLYLYFCAFADVDGLFVMQYTREGKDMVMTESSGKLEVIVDDTFRLTCAAAKFYYTSVNLTFLGQG